MTKLTEKQRSLTALLIWLVQKGGVVGGEDAGLDRYSGDFEPIDTLNLAFDTGLAQQIQHGDDDFTVRITPAGRQALHAKESRR